MTPIQLVANFLEYAILLRVPLLVAAAAILLPVVAFRTSARSLLRGLFDVSPPGMVAITLAASAAAGIVSNNALIIYRYSHLRVGSLALPYASEFPHIWLYLTLAISLPVIVTSLLFSARQNGKLGVRLLWTVATLAVSLALQSYAGPAFQRAVPVQLATRFLQFLHLGKGYLPGSASPGVDPLPDHLGAAGGFFLAFAIYLGLGVYGFVRLGKRHVVPALCSILMVLMLVCSSFSALSFLLDVRHIPVLLVVFTFGLIATWSPQSDHFYKLLPRLETEPAPTPAQIVNRPGAGKRIILVAANGGGIQAAAWTAQVLQGLQSITGFTPALSFISSVSGGSVGAAYFLYSLQDAEQGLAPAEAAAKSSIDEVAWGLAWPDLVRSVLPWICGHLIGRGRAIEKAWCLNAGTPPSPRSSLDAQLSGWNSKVRQGTMPAVIMNATIAETGERLLLGTTRLDRQSAIANARVDAADMHKINGVPMDVAIVTAARLSATFPYVTPASGSDAPGPRPHIVDGGYYDNYGMSSLVEWLDQALKETVHVHSVLVLQLHGAPVLQSTGDGVAPHEAKNRGWFYQLYAPLAALWEVRGAAQIAHNNLELQQLQEKWFISPKSIPIHSVTFEFPGDNAPLSWHLTAAEQQAIRDVWNSQELDPAKEQVRQFLNGNDAINCPCPTCQAHSGHR